MCYVARRENVTHIIGWLVSAPPCIIVAMIAVASNNFPATLRHAMEKRALTQEALSERSGVSQTTIGNILRGSDPRLSTLRRLVAAVPELLDPAQ